MKRHEIRERVNLGGKGSGHHGHKGIPGQRGGSAARGSVSGALDTRYVGDIAQEVLDTYKAKKPFHHGEWEEAARGRWTLSDGGVEYELIALSSTIYSKGRLRDPSKTRNLRDLELIVSRGGDKGYKTLLHTTARGESARDKISKNEARVVKGLNNIFGIEAGQYDWA